MYLVTAEGKAGGSRGEGNGRDRSLGGVAELVLKSWRWWRARGLERQRRSAKRQLYLLETMHIGPKQRLVLMRVGEERFLVGLGSEGVTSVLRVKHGGASEEGPRAGSEAEAGDGVWG